MDHKTHKGGGMKAERKKPGRKKMAEHDKVTAKKFSLHVYISHELADVMAESPYSKTAQVERALRQFHGLEA